MADSILVMIVEDDSDFAYLIQKAINGQPDMKIIGVCADKEQAVQIAQQNHPSIVLMDLNLSFAYMDGIEAAREIRLSTNAKVIILTAFENPEIVIEASKKSFASGYLFKSQFDFLVETVRETARGHTPQELMISSLILDDLTSAERSVLQNLFGHGGQLLSSQKTISNQKTMILKKLGLKNQKELNKIFFSFQDYF